MTGRSIPWPIRPLALALAAACIAAAPVDEIDARVGHLGSEQFARREAAARSLVDAGPAAIAPLERAIRGGDLEVSSRGIEVLRHMLDARDEAAAAAAAAALDRLAAKDDEVVGRLAAAAVVDPQVLALAATNLRPPTIRVNVIGEVRSPGRLDLPAGTAMVEAVLAAGGSVPWRGRSSQVELVRVNRDGTTRREFITLRDQQNVSQAFNPPLQNNDTVIVHRTLYAKSLDVLNQVLVPIGVAGNFFWIYRAFWP